MAMKQIDVIGCETPWGLKTIEIYHGDITKVSCDVLAISAFHKDYCPVPGTVIAALARNCNVIVKTLEQYPLLDLRKDFCVWISRPVENQLFKYLACVENMGTVNALSDMTSDVFSSIGFLEAKKIMVTSIALPLIGTGSMGESIRDIMPELIENSRTMLRKYEHLNKVLFVEFDDTKAGLIRDELRQSIGQSYAEPKTSQLIEHLRESVRADIDALMMYTSLRERIIIKELKSLFENQQPSTTELGVVARKLAEFIVESIMPKTKTNDLYQKITGLEQKGIAMWLIYYLHSMRIMGNEVVHLREAVTRAPQSISENDIAICMLCVKSILGFMKTNTDIFKQDIQEK